MEMARKQIQRTRAHLALWFKEAEAYFWRFVVRAARLMLKSASKHVSTEPVPEAYDRYRWRIKR